MTPTARVVELSAVALIGTDRAGKAAAAAVLAEAAVAASRARAGRAAARGAPIAQPCPDDTLPVCSQGAAAVLARVLGRGDWATLEEWADLAGAARRRIPEALLQTVLE